MSIKLPLVSLLIVAVVGGCVIGCPGFSQATLVEIDLFAPGDKKITRDTATGLEWLDLTETRNQWPNLVLAGTFVNDLGFRYATRSELDSLFIDIGFGPGLPASNFAPANLLVQLMGCSGFESPCDRTGGAFDVDVVTSSVSTRTVFINHGQSSAFINDLTSSLDGILDSFTVGTGNFLVRSAVVPEPSTMLFLGSCLAGLAGASWSRRRSQSLRSSARDEHESARSRISPTASMARTSA
jgi:hypothetical protein